MDAPRWTPPVSAWPALHSSPTCSLTVGAPGPAVMSLLLEELRRRRMRIKVAPDGRSVTARPWWPVVLGVVGAFVAGEGFSSPVLTVSVESEDASGVVLTVLVSASGLGGTGSRFVDALNGVAWRLAQSGVATTATPWERHSRFRKR